MKELLIVLMLFVVGCHPRKDFTTEHCIVDSTYIKPQESVSDYKPIYVSHFDCGFNIYNSSKKFEVKDTIIYLKYK